MKKNFLSIVKTCLVLFSGMFSAQAQQLGGIPDKTFNVADSGGSVVPLNKKNQIFFPGPNGGIFAETYQKWRMMNSQKNKLQFTADYFTKDLISNYFSQHITDAWRSGEVLEESPGVYYKVGNWFSSQGNSGLGNPNSIYGFGVDSINISKLSTGKIKPIVYQNSFYFKKPYLGAYKTGIVQTSASRLAFWLTYNPEDTLLGNQRHNHTYVRSLDTSCAPLAASIVLTNFRAQKSATYQGNLYLIGTDESVMPFPSTKIVVLDGNTLQIIPQTFPGFNINMLVYEYGLQFFKILPDGKFLLSGRFNDQPNQERTIRLNQDGSEDNTFSVTRFSNLPSRWCIDNQGVVRAATIVSVGAQSVARLGIIGQNGGIQFTDVPIDNIFAKGRALMYHPYYNAFLFESGDIKPDEINYAVGQGGDIYLDTLAGTRHRFFVSFNGSKWPLVNVSGVGMFYEASYVDVNPTINSKFLVFGNFTQVNKRAMPGIAVMHANGELDTTFKSTLTLTDDSLRYSIFKGLTHQPFMTNSGKILISASATRTWKSFTGRTVYQDTIRRLNPDGSLDNSYQKVWHHGTLRRAKNGDYYSIRFYENGIPKPVPSPGFGTTIKLVILDPEGNFKKELGSFTSNGSFPDTSISNILRYIDTYVQDAQGGFWVETNFSVPVPISGYANLQYYIRFDTSGRTKGYRFNFQQLSIPIKIEMLASKKLRLTGSFGLPDTTIFGRVVNVIETDSTGRFDQNVAPTQFYVPDVYASRYRLYAAPIMYQSDGKILSYLNTYNGNISFMMTRMQASGKQDNSFMPMSGIIWQSSINIIGDRLLLGNINYNWAGYQYNPRISYIHNSFKNGVHAFRLKSLPANTGFAQGRVTQVVSPATGCTPAGTQKSARGMIIKAAPGNRFTLSDSGGYYSLPLETGNYNLTQTIENNFLLRQVCPSANNAGYSLNIAGAGNASLGNDFINQTFDCPRLDLKVLDPRFRLCSKTSFQIYYGNDGVAPQPNARIRLNLPKEIRILSASKPFSKDADSAYVFDLGTLNPGQKGFITTVDTISCPTTPDSLARACFSARIEPLSLCSNINPQTLSWDGAWLDAVAKYNPTLDKVRVVVYNRGQAMSDSSSIRLTGPGLIYRNGKLKLAAGDSLVMLCEPAIIGSLQLQLQQPSACPLGSASRLNHSGKGSSSAFLNFGSGLLETYTVQACPVWRFSYDPNEKVVEPSGEIEPGTELDYTIHFENYGNDTAYAVTVEDSLPPYLDINTIKLGASSHRYTLGLEGTEANPILYFNFREIKLTGKKQDSIMSKGQLSFKIRTKANVARGTVISNRAHIYFDRNAPVITEYVHSKVAELGVLAENQGLVSTSNRMMLAPNPSSGAVKIWFSNDKQASTFIRILSMDGKLIRELKHSGGITEVQHLAPGIYLVSSPGTKPLKLIVLQ